jgi:dTMP kinase
MFIVFEGIDGSGKSTQARLLTHRLTAGGLDVLLTREPSDGPEGRALRNLAARGDPAEEARLFAADRRRHSVEVIQPCLRKGLIVVCDRYVYSSLAYQGARGLPLEEIWSLNAPFIVQPDVAFLLDVPVETAMKRLAARDDTPAAIFESRETLAGVAALYRTIATPPLVTVAGSGTPEAVFQRIVDILRNAPHAGHLAAALNGCTESP